MCRFVMGFAPLNDGESHCHNVVFHAPHQHWRGGHNDLDAAMGALLHGQKSNRYSALVAPVEGDDDDEVCAGAFCLRFRRVMVFVNLHCGFRPQMCARRAHAVCTQRAAVPSRLLSHASPQCALPRDPALGPKRPLPPGFP